MRLKGDCNVEILLRHNNKKLITHVNRLKPYFVQSPSAVSSPDFFPAQKDATPPPTQQQNVQLEKFYPYEDENLEEVVEDGSLALADVLAFGGLVMTVAGCTGVGAGGCAGGRVIVFVGTVVIGGPS